MPSQIACFPQIRRLLLLVYLGGLGMIIWRRQRRLPSLIMLITRRRSHPTSPRLHGALLSLDGDIRNGVHGAVHVFKGPQFEMLITKGHRVGFESAWRLIPLHHDDVCAWHQRVMMISEVREPLRICVCSDHLETGSSSKQYLGLGLERTGWPGGGVGAGNAARAVLVIGWRL